MVTQKIWTAHDVSKNRSITIYQLPGGRLRFVQPYFYTDANGEDIEDLGEHVNVTEIDFSALPQNIRDALVEIQNYMYNAALSKEGMV